MPWARSFFGNLAVASAPIRSLLLNLGIDGPVFYTLLWRIGMAISALGAILLLPLMLTPVEQGYYFTFESLINLKVVFDLGFSVVVTQFASHEMADLHWTLNRTVDGSAVAKSNLAYLARVAAKWYGYAGLLISLTLIPGGLWFFSTSRAQHGVTWMTPWLLLVVVTAGSLILSPLFALLEGCGVVRDVARMRVIEITITSLTLWASLTAGFGLYALVFAGAAGLIWQLFWLYSNYSSFLHDLRRNLGISGLSWSRDILPLQWRLAVGWVSGYCVINSITPIVFHVSGPALAGRVGMTLFIAQGILVLSIAIVKTKVPHFGRLIAHQQFNELDSLYHTAARQALLFAATGSALFFGAVLFMPSLGLGFHHRLVDALPLALILVATIINSIFQSQALYLRSHKIEPYLVLALVQAAISLPLYYVGLRNGGALGAAGAYLAIAVGAGGWASVIFHRFRAARAERGPLPVAS